MPELGPLFAIEFSLDLIIAVKGWVQVDCEVLKENKSSYFILVYFFLSLFSFSSFSLKIRRGYHLLFT